MMDIVRGVGVFLLVVIVGFLIGGVYASTYRADFVVEGCEVGTERLAVDSCSQDGTYYCKERSRTGTRPTLQNTLLDEDACVLGGCCPSGYVCDESDTKTCVLRGIQCGSYNSNQEECEENSCTWINTGGVNDVCVDKPKDYSCSIYQKQEACEGDVWNLGSNGIGTDVCGTTTEAQYDGNKKGFYIPQESCRCVWDVGAGTCRLRYTVQDDIYSIGATPKSGTCEKAFEAGACESGTQVVQITGIWDRRTYDPSPSLEAAVCASGNETRVCGEPVYRLPGFSTLALLLSILLLVGYYARKE